MIVIPDNILEFLLPEIKNFNCEEVKVALTKIHLEVEKVLSQNVSNKKFFKSTYLVKPVCALFDYPSLWVLSREIALVLDISKGSSPSEKEIISFFSSSELISYLLNICEKKTSSSYEENLWIFFKLIFGEPEKNLSIFKLGIQTFFHGKNISWGKFFPEAAANLIEKLVKEKISLEKQASSKISLSTLLPIFSDFKKNWKNLVVNKLIFHYFSFKELDSSGDRFEVYWPIWYKQENLPSFNEILFRLLDFSLEIKKIRARNYEKLSEGITLPNKLLTFILSAKNYLVEKGFVECNTSKFSSCSELNSEVELVLEYNPLTTLRDDIANSLVNQVLLKNLNIGNNLYPIFELAFCPWKSKWQLALLSTVLLLSGDEKYITQQNIFFYDLQEMYSFLKGLLGSEIDIKPLKVLKKIKNSEGTTEFAHIFSSKNEQIGVVKVHRLEPFEIRHMEILSIVVDLQEI